MSATVEQRSSTLSSHGIRWLRVVAGGILLEFALVAVLVPVGEIFGAPPGLGRNQTGAYTVFFTAVPLACIVLGYLAGWIVVRKVPTRFAAHGLLVGIVATTFYLAVSSLNPQGLSAVILAYGPIHFWSTQILRIAGCTVGGAWHGKVRV